MRPGGFTAAQLADISYVIRYLEHGSAGRFIDTTANDLVVRTFKGYAGFFPDLFAHAPVSTLLRMIINPDVILNEEIVVVVPPTPPTPPAPPFVKLLTDSLAAYGILAAGTVNNQGPSVVNGNLGVSPGNSVSDDPPGSGVVHGDVHLGDAESEQAQVDLAAAWDQIDVLTESAVELDPGLGGGQSIAPGIYRIFGDADLGTGSIVLDGGGNINAGWVIRVDSSLFVDEGCGVFLTGGAQAKNVYWQVRDRVELYRGSFCKGTIIAQSDFFADSLASAVEGRWFTRNGSFKIQQITVTVPLA